MWWLPRRCCRRTAPLNPTNAAPPRHAPITRDTPPRATRQIQKRKFEIEVKTHTLVHEQLIQFYKGFKHDAHPMAIMVRLYIYIYIHIHISIHICVVVIMRMGVCGC